MTNDQIIALFASLGACFSAIATFLTVRQIAKQRQASYRPELALSRVSVVCKKDPIASSTIPTFWAPMGDDGKSDSLSRTFSLPLSNIGLGTAKAISVLWSFPFESVTKQVNDLAQKTLSAAYFKFEKDLLILDSENLGKSTSMWCNQKHETLDYVLPAAVHHEPVMLKLPHAYTQIVSSLLYFSIREKDRESFPEIPPLIAKFEFLDIGETKYSATFSIQFQISTISGGGEFINGYVESRKNV
ncbi:MAG: hypothetical protein DU481_11915 [Nitrosomonas sp.]|uniref:hypothetical protein n=1 Tax=Nitrosomonas sp. TaxID=42353 RepID=UPI0032EF82E5